MLDNDLRDLMDGDRAEGARRAGSLQSVLHSAAQLPFDVAAGIADEVTFQTESITHAGRNEAQATHSNQLYHESDAEMRDRAQASSRPPAPEDNSQTLHNQPHVPAASNDEATLPDTSTVSVPAPPPDSMAIQQSSIPAEGTGAFPPLQPPPDTAAEATEPGQSPKKTVPIQNGADTERISEYEPAHSHLVASKRSDSNEGLSESSGVSQVCCLEFVLKVQCAPCFPFTKSLCCACTDLHRDKRTFQSSDP